MTHLPLSHRPTLSRFARRAALLVAVQALSACSILPSLPSIPSIASLTSGDGLFGVIKPYRMDIVQGNVVTREQAAQVKPGMPRAQVRDILGSPMLTDVFHGDRWDYVFTIRRPGTEPQRRTVVAYFKGDVLERLDAPALPTEREFVSSISRANVAQKTPVLELTPEQKKALPAPADQAPAEPTPATGALRSYPPLEPA